MISREIIVRLQKKNWFVECKTEQEANLILQACYDAEIKWASKEDEIKFKSFDNYPISIVYNIWFVGINIDVKENLINSGMDNITVWFFNAIKNKDGKLIPQNAEQEHLVQILLAKMQGISVECWSSINQEWLESNDDSMSISAKYRINPKPKLTLTPLPISRELWSYIDKKWKYAAMKENKTICFYARKPTLNASGWYADSFFMDSPLNINTVGIKWETSLTERPKDV